VAGEPAFQNKYVRNGWVKQTERKEQVHQNPDNKDKTRTQQKAKAVPFQPHQ
jgi:hypothetical protein